ncbi:SiaB family protein kinase [Azospirillum sp.]|uniref:SiaB family protein kinase n=1 Tax=Azospirillum sp. TaxID=34012 RepID=UPI002D6E43CF|nr:SiaB family protein kinase [Azospirillum sp.]HYF85537.1 SiaB family protein kinase [Azospirillum sp.]
MTRLFERVWPFGIRNEIVGTGPALTENPAAPMLAQQYAAIKRDLDDKGILFSFSGYLSEGILYSLGEALREKMALEEADGPTIRRVFSVFVEQMQNIIRYSAEKMSGSAGRAVELSAGMVTIGVEDGKVFIVCGNTVRNGDVPRLKQRLDHLKSLDRNGIKSYYREQLREEPDDGSRGATLGLIEIARRASDPIDYDFNAMDADRSFFCLKVRV